MEQKKQDILKRLGEMERENRALTAALSDEISLLAYKSRTREGEQAGKRAEIWTDALQAALNEHEIVRIPAGLYWIDRTVTIPSNRRIEAEEGAVIRLMEGVRVLMLRSEHTQDGTHRPISADNRDVNIAIHGGRWEESNTRRAGYGRTGMYDEARSFFGVSTLMFFNHIEHLTLTGMTFSHTAGFAVQAGDAKDVLLEDITFSECFADGLHLNGNMENVVVRRVRGQVGDDLVALNVYDWQNSSVDFGPMKTVLCEGLELSQDSPCKAMRIEPGLYFYDDGTSVDCSLTDAIIRDVKGIRTFKMYFQTPPYRPATERPERGGVGSGDGIFFENIDIDLSGPIDGFEDYLNSHPVTGSFAAFEMGANLGRVFFEDIRLKLHPRYPMSFLVAVGPKSVRRGEVEVFDPYLSSRVEEITLRNIFINGEQPEDIAPYLHEIVFDHLYEDGESTARGVLNSVRYLR